MVTWQQTCLCRWWCCWQWHLPFWLGAHGNYFDSTHGRSAVFVVSPPCCRYFFELTDCRTLLMGMFERCPCTGLLLPWKPQCSKKHDRRVACRALDGGICKLGGGLAVFATRVVTTAMRYSIVFV